MEIRLSDIVDRKQIIEIYAQARKFMIEQNNPHQWADSGYPSIDLIDEDIEQDADYGKFWMPRLSAIKNYATETALEVVQEITRASGGRSYSNNQELSRLLRDVHAGLFQPSDQESLHNAWAKILLGPIED